MKKLQPLYLAGLIVLVSVLSGYAVRNTKPEAPPQNAPAPLLAQGHAVDWWFVFKLNVVKFPECGGAQRACLFDKKLAPRKYAFGQQYIFASSDSPKLASGAGCVGDTTADPVGSTFDQIYNGSYHYVIWNDQFYLHPEIKACAGSKSCSQPWAHSKGMVAWDNSGNGIVMQVTTPSWPGAGSKDHPRANDGNTLGCVEDDNVKYSQHFFALKLNKSDLLIVLKALQNASVVTDPKNPQIVDNGGPSDVQGIVSSLGSLSKSQTVTTETLSSGVRLISKPSALRVPPWQMVSAVLGGVPLRTATWWSSPTSRIPTTTESTPIKCWSPSLGKAGAVEIATSGSWDKTTFSLMGGLPSNNNHAKFGVSLSSNQHLSIFGDMNQEGTLSAKGCAISQNPRGGLFFVVDNEELTASLTDLIKGSTAPTKLKKPPATKKAQPKKNT